MSLIGKHGHKKPSFIAVILAGGRSSRMGKDKSALLRPDGGTQLEFMVHCAEAAGAEQVLISGKTLTGYTSVKDQHPDNGPLAGIEAALDWLLNNRADSAETRLLVLPCDLPYFTPEAIADLLEHHGSCAYEDSFLPCAIAEPAFALTQLRELLKAQQANIGKASMKRFLATVSACLLRNTHQASLKNVNFYSDWEIFLNS
ncbi:MAG: molybdenum cofactor guanylyltransferase [Thalassolituus sp.]